MKRILQARLPDRRYILGYVFPSYRACLEQSPSHLYIGVYHIQEYSTHSYPYLGVYQTQPPTQRSMSSTCRGQSSRYEYFRQSPNSRGVSPCIYGFSSWSLYKRNPGRLHALFVYGVHHVPPPLGSLHDPITSAAMCIRTRGTH